MVTIEFCQEGNVINVLSQHGYTLRGLIFAWIIFGGICGIWQFPRN